MVLTAPLVVDSEQNNLVSGSTAALVDSVTPTGTPRRVLHRYGNSVLLYKSPDMYTLETTRVAGTTDLRSFKLFNLAGVHSSVEYLGKLFISLKEGATGQTAGKGVVYSWDGTTLFKDLDTGPISTGARPLMAAYRETLYWINNLVTANNILWKLNPGVNDLNNWIGVALPTTTWSSFDWAVYKDVLYIAGRDDLTTTYAPRILSYSGTPAAPGTVTQVNSPSATGSTRDDGEGVLAMCVFDGFLFYAWQKISSGKLMIGRFDGTTWVDEHKDLGTQLSLVACGAMVVYNNELYVGAWKGANTGRIYKSPGTVTTGTWTQVTSSQAFTDGVNDLLVGP